MPESVLVPINEDQYLAHGSLLLLVLTLGSIFGGNYLSRSVHPSLNTPILATLLGVLVGLILAWQGPGETYLLNTIVAFNQNVFLVFILPPIIFASGYELRGRRGQLFFTRFGTILWFALFATLLAFLINALGFYLTGILRLSVRFSLSQALALGALLSPTDPVTVLALFKDMSINPLMEIMVLGESLLNDAVAILVYRMIVESSTPEGFSWGVVLWGVLSFGWLFTLSMTTGGVVGLLIALLMKWIRKSRNEMPLETLVLMVAPWLSYLLAEGISCSGIVSVLFCGISMARYATVNLSDSGATVAASLYAAASSLAESLVFVLLGLSAFSFRVLWQPMLDAGARSDESGAGLPNWLSWVFKSVELGRVIFLHLFTIIYATAGRFFSIIVTSNIVNYLLDSREESAKLPPQLQWVVSLACLRGAMSLALALKAQTDIGGSQGSAMVSTTLVYTLFTVLVVGPVLPYAFDCLRINADKSETPAALSSSGMTPSLAEPLWYASSPQFDARCPTSGRVAR